VVVMAKPKQYTWWERVYIFEVIRGLSIIFYHFWVNILGFIPGLKKLVKSETVTVQWPEEQLPISPRWRGRHRLNRDENGLERCVACMCCATACPSECIHIVAAESDDPRRREKYPAEFNIDLFRCVYCGMCVEACPCNAILMDTQDMRFSQTSPDKFVIDKQKLLDW
jgi:NADH-quinone oxidoreductase subunit I